MGQLLGDKYRLEPQFCGGSYGRIYRGVDTQTNEEVAIKQVTKRQQLQNESYMYRILQGGTGVPNMRWSGSYYMVIDMLGPSLNDLFNYCGENFSLKTVLMLANQLIKRIEYVHSKGILHQDIKPENFLMGLGHKRNQCYIIDFGLAKQYCNRANHEHIRYGHEKATGTGRCVSINAHLGIVQSRRDDLISLGYLLMYFLRGSLPWQGRDEDNKKRYKISTSTRVLCKSYPQEFAEYFYYCRALRFDEKPDYAKLQRMFCDLFTRSGFKSDSVFDWNVMYFLRKSLPWQKLHEDVKKLQVSCKSYPQEFANYFSYYHALSFDEKQDYAKLQRMFCNLVTRSAGQEGHAGTSRAAEGFNSRSSRINGIALNPTGSQSKYKSSGQDDPLTSERVVRWLEGVENECGNSTMRTGSTSRTAVLSSRPTVSAEHETGEQFRPVSNILPSSLHSSGSAAEPKRSSISRNPSMRSQKENYFRN